jgi:hypothetical protein
MCALDVTAVRLGRPRCPPATMPAAGQAAWEWAYNDLIVNVQISAFLAGPEGSGVFES